MKLYSFFSHLGKASLIQIEYHARFQIPSFQILGLPGPEIQEAKERIISAFQSLGMEFPKKRVVVNLSPASIKKWGTGHDLGIALAVYFQVQPASIHFKNAIAWGELGLDGRVHPKNHMATLIELLLNEGSIDALFLSTPDARQFFNLLDWRKQNQLPLPRAISVYQVDTLLDLNTPKIAKADGLITAQNHEDNPNLHDLLPLSSLQERILSLATLGRLHTLLIGPKGVGKSETLKWFQALQRAGNALTLWENVLYQETKEEPIYLKPSVRSVHSQVRPAHLVGSVSSKGFKAGELSLAHGGILIADEFVEWPRDSKESLREPLQNKSFHLTRAQGNVSVKCDLQLLATGNLCPCGGLPHQLRAFVSDSPTRCRCKPDQVKNYIQKLSGPILDRMDLTLLLSKRSESSMSPKDQLKSIKTSIERAIEFSKESLREDPQHYPPNTLQKLKAENAWIERHFEKEQSARSVHKVVKLARLIQILDQDPVLKETHVLEAKSYRILDHMMDSI